MKILVTGGAGFIGSHLVDKLVELGNDVTVIDNSKENIDRNLKEIESKIDIVHADVNDIHRLPKVSKFNWFVHLAALADIVPSIENPKKYHEANVSGTVAALEFARRYNVDKFIYAASASCYGNKPKVPSQETDQLSPQYPYALTKLIGEEYALHYHKVYKLPVISLRFFNVYGPRSRTTGAYGAVFGVFLKQKLENKPFTVVGDGSQSRDFIYVSDVVDAIIMALKSDKSGEVYNIGAGSHTSIRNLVNLLGNGFGRIENLPKRPGEPDITLAWIGKAQKDLGFMPKVSFPEGVKKMIENIDYWKEAPLWTKDKIEKATEEWFRHLGG